MVLAEELDMKVQGEYLFMVYWKYYIVEVKHNMIFIEARRRRLQS